jgi:hypothetical protein
MTAIIADNAPLEVTCGNCKKKIKKTVGWFKRTDCACPHCAAKIDTSDFRRGLDDAQREVERAFKSMSDTLKRKF